MEKTTRKKVTYIVEGVEDNSICKGSHRITLDSSEEDKLAAIKRDGFFIDHVPEMWPDKCTEGNCRRDPGYDIKYKLTRIEKITETVVTEYEEISLT